MNRYINCVLLTCFDQDVRFWATMLCDHGIRLHRADTLEMADFLLLATGGTVLLSDTRFLDGSWEHAASMVQSLHPQVALLLCAESVDADAAARAWDYGAVGLLWKPMELWRMRSSILSAHEVAIERLLWRPSAARIRNEIGRTADIDTHFSGQAK